MIKDFRIRSIEGYTSQIGHLVSIMELTRGRTIKIIKDLTVKQLDYLEPPFRASIGTLLRHVCCVEYVNQVYVFDRRQLDQNETAIWENGFSNNLDKSLIRGLPIAYYLQNFEDVRADTLVKLKNCEDEWLYSNLPSKTGASLNNYYMLFHIVEEEIHHMGQIRLLLSKVIPS